MDFVVGILVGVLLCFVFGGFDWLFKSKPKKPSGSFIMDFSDPDKDICKLELSEDLNDIYTKKEIVLTVVARDYSQK